MKRYSKYYYEYFDTSIQIIGYCKNKNEFDYICKDIEKTLSEYNRLLDIYNEYEGVNNLYTLNAANEAVELDEKVISLLEYCIDVYALTEKSVNIAMGSVLKIWHEYRDAGTKNPSAAVLPPREVLSKAAEHTDINNIIINRAEKTVRLADAEMSLDVGAVAKGWVCERIAESLEKNGISGFLINAGGNVKAVGAKPDDNLWSVGIQNPDETDSQTYIEYLSIENTSVVTSGDYQRFYTVNGVRYNHIISPETLFPAEKAVSVTVTGADSALCDALSTALFITGAEEGAELLTGLEGYEAMWLLPGGEKIYTPGFPK